MAWAREAWTSRQAFPDSNRRIFLLQTQKRRRTAGSLRDGAC
jgi:hypothetical protein